MADGIGQDDEILLHVERLAGAIEFIGELAAQELRAGAAGAVQHHDGVDDVALVVGARRAQRAVMLLQFGQAFASAEDEIPDDIIALPRRCADRACR